MAPGVPRQYFQHGYQRRGHGSEIVYPYILVQVHGKGPVREEEVARLAEEPDLAGKTLKSTQSKMTNLISDVDKSSSTYDYTRHVLKMKSRMEVPGVGAIDMISTAFLTSKGTLNFNCYSMESDADSMPRVYLPAIDSVRLAEGFTYKPPRGFDVPEFLIYGLVGGCVGLVFALGRRLFMGKARKISPGGT